MTKYFSEKLQLLSRLIGLKNINTKILKPNHVPKFECC